MEFPNKTGLLKNGVPIGLKPWLQTAVAVNQKRKPLHCGKMRLMQPQCDCGIGVDKGSHGKKIDFSEQDAKSNQDMKLGREGERGRELGREKERERGRERRRVTDRDRRKERWSETDTAKTSVKQDRKDTSPNRRTPNGSSSRRWRSMDRREKPYGGQRIEVLRQQLELAKELNKPASVHCVCAFGDLLELMKSMGPFPAGVILHSYLGSAEMIDAPDALPMSNIDSLHFVEGDTSLTEELLAQTTTSSTSGSSLGNASHVLADASMLPKETLNHPANIHNVLDYVASVLEITKEELADLSYQNAVRLLSYKVYFGKFQLEFHQVRADRLQEQFANVYDMHDS
ncbi:hypothetical protein JHK85_046129 [Glycine max]|nr:hypothetical protein JHK85_046129 [Glycine max]